MLGGVWVFWGCLKFIVCFGSFGEGFFLGFGQFRSLEPSGLEVSRPLNFEAWASNVVRLMGSFRSFGCAPKPKTLDPKPIELTDDTQLRASGCGRSLGVLSFRNFKVEKLRKLKP